MIDYLIHFYRSGTEPFQSLSALSDMDAMQIPSQYLQARQQIERWLRQEFIAKGGIPQESYPIYNVHWGRANNSLERA